MTFTNPTPPPSEDRLRTALDAERLAHAYNNVIVATGTGRGWTVETWGKVAAEYAALSPAKVSESEARCDFDCDACNDPGPCSCGGRRWVEDENWSQDDPRHPVERTKGDGLIPCGFCNHGGWDVAEYAPDPFSPPPLRAAAEPREGLAEAIDAIDRAESVSLAALRERLPRDAVYTALDALTPLSEAINVAARLTRPTGATGEEPSDGA